MEMFNETQTHITHTDNNIPKMLIRSCYIDNEEFKFFIFTVVDFYTKKFQACFSQGHETVKHSR